jgi:hypothetical protein
MFVGIRTSIAQGAGDTVRVGYREITVTGDLCDGEYKLLNREQHNAVTRDLEERQHPCALKLPAVNYNDSIIIGVIQSVCSKKEPEEIREVYYLKSSNEIVLRHKLVPKGICLKSFQRTYFVKIKRPAEDVEVHIRKK